MPGDALVVERAPLPAVGHGVGERTHFVRTQPRQMIALAEENAHMRSEEFVGGADEEVAIERGHVDEAVRAIVHGVDVGKRTGGVSQADDRLHRIDRAHGIRCVADGDKLGAFADFAGQVGDIERAIFFVDFGPADGDAFVVLFAIFGEREPGRDVGVVIEAGDQDFVPGTEVARDRTRDGVGKGGHVLAEDDFVGGAVEEVGHGFAGGEQHGIGVAAGGVGSASVGVVAAQVVGDSVDHALWNLRTAGAVEERGGVAVDGLGECGELGADVGEVEGGGGIFSNWHGIHILGWLFDQGDTGPSRGYWADFFASAYSRLILGCTVHTPIGKNQRRKKGPA